MDLINFVSKCLSKKDDRTHRRVHGADNNKTFCGKKLDEMWYVHPTGKTIEDITCEYCLKAMRKTSK